MFCVFMQLGLETLNGWPNYHNESVPHFRFIFKNNGVLFENDLIQIGVKSEYRQNLGRLGLFYGNKTQTALTVSKNPARSCWHCDNQSPPHFVVRSTFRRWSTGPPSRRPNSMCRSRPSSRRWRRAPRSSRC